MSKGRVRDESDLLVLIPGLGSWSLANPSLHPPIRPGQSNVMVVYNVTWWSSLNSLLKDKLPGWVGGQPSCPSLHAFLPLRQGGNA